MKVWKMGVIVLLILMSLAIVPAMVEAGNGADRGTKIPYDFWVKIPCAAGGKGEIVHFTGFKHWFVHTTTDNNGGDHVRMHESLLKLTGRGEKPDGERNRTIFIM